MSIYGMRVQQWSVRGLLTILTSFRETVLHFVLNLVKILTIFQVTLFRPHLVQVNFLPKKTRIPISESPYYFPLLLRASGYSHQLKDVPQSQSHRGLASKFSGTHLPSWNAKKKEVARFFFFFFLHLDTSAKNMWECFWGPIVHEYFYQH